MLEKFDGAAGMTKALWTVTIASLFSESALLIQSSSLVCDRPGKEPEAWR